MSKDFEQISLEPFMKHNGSVLFKTISENECEFETLEPRAFAGMYKFWVRENQKKYEDLKLKV